MSEITAIRLRTGGDYVFVDVEQRGEFINIIREYCPDAPPISHIKEMGKKPTVMVCTADGLKVG